MADTKTSALSAASTLAGTEVLPVVQGGATVKATITQVTAHATTAGDARYERLVAVTALKTSAYPANANEFVPLDTTGGTFALTLPTAPADGTLVYGKWSVGTAAPTVALGGSDVLNVAGGSTGFTWGPLNTVYGFRYKATGAIWYIETSYSKGGMDSLYSPIALTIPSDQTGTTYTLVLTDVDNSIGMSNASAITLTIPTNASVAWPVGRLCEIRQVGAGQITVAAAGGVTLRSPGTLVKSRVQYSALSLLKIASDTWSLQGDLA